VTKPRPVVIAVRILWSLLLLGGLLLLTVCFLAVRDGEDALSILPLIASAVVILGLLTTYSRGCSGITSVRIRLAGPREV